MTNQQNAIPETVNNSMSSAISLLHPMATLNQEQQLQSVYFEPNNGVAIAGFRREVANFGVGLVKAQYGKDNTVQVGRSYIQRNGFVNFNRGGEYFETDLGLPGKMMNNGDREAINAAAATDYIESVKAKVKDKYEVGLNPGMLHSFMDNLIQRHKVGLRDRKVNLQFTTGITSGHLLAIAERMPDGELALITTVPTLNGPKTIKLFIHEKSKIHVTQLQPKVTYIVKPIGFDEKTNRRYASVVRPHMEGIRMAVQGFRMGIIKPGDPGYDVNPDNNNGLLSRDIKDFKYISGQKREKIQGAPMVTIDFDMFSRLMHTFSGYPYVVMHFKNSTDGLYFHAPGNEYMPELEGILGGTIQHVRGRIWLP